jgi:hypothetical protein
MVLEPIVTTKEFTLGQEIDSLVESDQANNSLKR